MQGWDTEPYLNETRYNKHSQYTKELEALLSLFICTNNLHINLICSLQNRKRSFFFTINSKTIHWSTQQTISIYFVKPTSSVVTKELNHENLTMVK